MLTQSETFRKSLPVDLTLEELKSKAEDMAAAVKQFREYEDEKKAASKHLGELMKDERAKIEKLATVVKDGREFREIECTMTFFFETCTVEIRRVDTGAKVDTRAMTKEEMEEYRQMSLPA